MTTTPPTPELAACPFCGASASGYAIEPHTHALELGGWKMPDHEGSYVIEGNCACGSGLIGASQEEVTAKWNRRAPVAATGKADERDAADAARYRWLRECSPVSSTHSAVTINWPVFKNGKLIYGERLISGAELDAAIDEVMP